MSVRALVLDLRPEEGEGWGDKLRRTVRALGNAFTRKSEHDDARVAAREAGGEAS